MAHGSAEILEFLDHHEKGAFSRHHAGGVILVEIGNIAFRVLVHDGKAVDGDAVVGGRVVDVLQRNAVIVGAIARYVDDFARGDDFPVAFVEHERGAFERAADRGARAGRARDAADFFGQGRGARFILHEGPIEHDPVIVGARPIEHGHRDAPQRAALDRLDDVGIEKDFRDSLALKLRLLVIDAERHVGRDDELDVDLDRAFRRSGGGQGRERGQHGAEQGQFHPATEHLAARLRPHRISSWNVSQRSRR